MPPTDRDGPSSLLPSVELVPGGAVDGTIRPPGSKSLTNRALICAALAHGRSHLTGALRSEDTEVMIDALRTLGVQIDIADAGRTLTINTTARPVGTRGSVELFVANSGTSIRFLTAMLSAAGGNYVLRGVERMHQRPIGDLVDAIRPVMRGEIQATSSGDCPPVRITSDGWNGRDIEVAGSVSSQYLSGLMMAAPIAQQALASGQPMWIRVTGPLVSRPYVEMTAEVMRAFGADVDLVSEESPSGPVLAVEIGTGEYWGTDYPVEPDASAASYFWGAAAITGGRVTVEGLSRDAIQGDVGFCDVLAKMGCDVKSDHQRMTVVGRPLRGVDVDMNEISDTVQTLAVVALFADGPTRVRGVAHNRFKETDRIGHLAQELRKLGGTIHEHDDGMTIEPPQDKSKLHGATLETYHDHRMAMSLSLAGLRIAGVQILDPACTSKTYPEYFADLQQLIGRAHLWTGV